MIKSTKTTLMRNLGTDARNLAVICMGACVVELVISKEDASIVLTLTLLLSGLAMLFFGHFLSLFNE